MTATCARSSRRGTRSSEAEEKTHAFFVAALPSAQTRTLTLCDPLMTL